MSETKVENPDIQVTGDAPEVVVEEQLKVAPKAQTDSKGGYWWGTGRRKSSVARVRIKPGSGKMVVNKKDLDDYFKRTQDQNNVMAALKAVKAEKAFDVFINVKGGGTTGQSGASLLLIPGPVGSAAGPSRAIELYFPSANTSTSRGA